MSTAGPGAVPRAVAEVDLREAQVVFRVGPVLCSVGVEEVREVLFPRALTRMPQMPPFFEGLFRFRDTMVPVLDMRKRFEVEPSRELARSRVLLVVIDARVVGLHVDEVHRVVRVDPSEIAEVPAGPGGVDPRFVRGAHEFEGEPCFILRLGAVLSSEERVLIDALPEQPLDVDLPEAPPLRSMDEEG